MPFKMRCPKCGGTDYVIHRDNLRYPGVDESFALVFSCRCGKQLFGSLVVEEYERQKKQYEADAEARLREEREREARETEEREHQERLQRALAFRNEYLRRKREQEEARERQAREEQDRRWRERVATGDDPRPAIKEEAAPVEPPAPAPPPEPKPRVHDDEEEEIVEDPDKDPRLCAWPPCQNERRPNSKYCSRACSNKNARWRYRQRRKAGEVD